MKTTDWKASITTLSFKIVACIAILGAGTAYGQAPADKSAQQGPQLTVPLGLSKVVDAPWPVKRMSVTNPETADVQALTPKKVLVMGKSVGSTDIFFWSESDEGMQTRVDVTVNLSQLEAVLSKTFSGSDLELTQSQDVVIVSGALAQAHDVQHLRKLLEASGVNYVDRTSLAGVQQVQLQVRIAEVSRTAIRALGVNALAGGDHGFGGQTIGPAMGGPLNPLSIGAPAGAPFSEIPFEVTKTASVASPISLFGGYSNSFDLEVFVQALSENQYLRLLAEPNLVALSGEEASFLAGGEFPIPIVQGSTLGGLAISIEYKEFGVRLSFRPTVLGQNKIRLHVAPEVSEITQNGAVEIEGFQIPAVATRRAETTLDLYSGQTFAMAGLLNRTTAARNSRIPVLGDLPILGSLFRSVRYQKGETEMVVMVTASLVEPLSIADTPPMPGTLEIAENDWEIFIEGSIEGKNPKLPPRVQPAVFRTMGLDRLRGPGAWTSHDSSQPNAVESKARSESASDPVDPVASPEGEE